MRASVYVVFNFDFDLKQARERDKLCLLAQMPGKFFNIKNGME